MSENLITAIFHLDLHQLSSYHKETQKKNTMKNSVRRNIYSLNSFNIFQKNLNLYCQIAGLPKICQKTFLS